MTKQIIVTGCSDCEIGRQTDFKYCRLIEGIILNEVAKKIIHPDCPLDDYNIKQLIAYRKFVSRMVKLEQKTIKEILKPIVGILEEYPESCQWRKSTNIMEAELIKAIEETLSLARKAGVDG